MSSSSKGPSKGYTFIELAVIGSLLSMLVLIAVPNLVFWSGVVHVRLAAGEVAGFLSQARMYSIRHQSNVAVRFENVAEGPKVAMYRDHDGDGVRSNDIRRGIDERIMLPRIIAMTGGRVRFGFPAGLGPRDPSDLGRRLVRLSDPIRFNNSDMASFSPLGTATPGTVYLTAADRHLAAVRVNARSGHITILLYDSKEEVWRRAW